MLFVFINFMVQPFNAPYTWKFPSYSCRAFCRPKTSLYRKQRYFQNVCILTAYFNNNDTRTFRSANNGKTSTHLESVDLFG